MTAARVLVLAGLLLLGTAAAPGFAHNLVTSETAPGSWGSSISIDDPTVSRVYVSTGVPVIGRLSGFRPFSAIVGPGLPPADLGFELPPAAGAQVLAPGSSPREFHEGVTGTDSWIVMEETVTLPAAGEYWFVAFAGDPAEAAARQWDKLWMAIGTKERFGIADIFRLGSIRRHVREFHEVK